MKVSRVPIPCPNCHEELHIRRENLGRKGICKHCGHVFRARQEETGTATTLPLPSGESDRDGRIVERLRSLECLFQSVLVRLSDRVAPDLAASRGLDDDEDRNDAARPDLALERESMHDALDRLRAEGATPRSAEEVPLLSHDP